MLTSRFAMWMGWGPDLTFFYNDAYGSMTLGAKHPWALGRPARDVWAEISPSIYPRIDKVLSTGTATWDERLLLFLERSGFAEETYHTFSYSPISDDSGVTSGMLCVVTEETERVIGERRLSRLHDLASRLSSAIATEDVLQATTASLSDDARDLPFTLTYQFVPEDARPRLVAATGIDPNHPGIRLGEDGAHALWPLQRDRQSGAVRVPLPPQVDWPSGVWNVPRRMRWSCRLPTRASPILLASLSPGSTPIGCSMTRIGTSWVSSSARWAPDSRARARMKTSAAGRPP